MDDLPQSVPDTTPQEPRLLPSYHQAARQVRWADRTHTRARRRYNTLKPWKATRPPAASLPGDSIVSRSLTRLQAVLLGAAVLAGLVLATSGLFAVGSRQWFWSDAFHV